MTGIWLYISVFIAGHMLAGIRGSTLVMSQARAVVMAEVVSNTPLSLGATRVELKTLRTPCGAEIPASVTVYQLADHTVNYRNGQRVVMPLRPLSESPHTLTDVPKDGWFTEQAAHELIEFPPSDDDALFTLLRQMCGPDRTAALVEALESRWNTLAGGAALELSTSESLSFSERARSGITRLISDRTRPTSLRITAANLAGRSGDRELLSALSACVVPTEPQELVSAALKAGAPVKDSQLLTVLMGPAGPQRLIAANRAANIHSDAFLGPLEVLAWGPEPGAPAASCAALQKHGEQGRAAREKLVRVLPPEKSARCAAARL